MQWRQEETEVVKKRKQIEEQFLLAKRRQSSEHRAQLHNPTQKDACRPPLSTKSEEALQLHDPTKEDEYRPQLSTKSEEAVQTIHENERVESIKVTLATRRDEGEHIRIVAIQTKAAERREAHKLQQVATGSRAGMPGHPQSQKTAQIIDLTDEA